jgi:hypothetical protein
MAPAPSQSKTLLDVDYFLGASGAAFAGASVVAGLAGAGAAFFSAAGAPFAFAGAAFSFAGAAFSFAGAAFSFAAGAAGAAGWAGATVVAGDAGAGFCCAVAAATKPTNVSKLTIRTSFFICVTSFFGGRSLVVAVDCSV